MRGHRHTVAVSHERGSPDPLQRTRRLTQPPPLHAMGRTAYCILQYAVRSGKAILERHNMHQLGWCRLANGMYPDPAIDISNGHYADNPQGNATPWCARSKQPAPLMATTPPGSAQGERRWHGYAVAVGFWRTPTHVGERALGGRLAGLSRLAIVDDSLGGEARWPGRRSAALAWPDA